jgi:hypothetical protein
MSATAMIRCVETDQNRMAIINLKNGPFDVGNFIFDDGTPAGGEATITSMDVGDQEDIFEYVKAANDASLSGYSDWRIPNIAELASIMTYNSVNGHARPNATYFTFPGTTEIIWSSTHDGALYPYATAAQFSTGKLILGTASSKSFATGYVYLVRGPETTGTYPCIPIQTSMTYYTDANFKCDAFYKKGTAKSWQFNTKWGNVCSFTMSDGTLEWLLGHTVYDNNTGLEWMAGISNNTYPFYDNTGQRGDALEFMRLVNNSSYPPANKNDWRIPTLFEFLSILICADFKLWSTAFFQNTKTLWTCTSRPDNTDLVFQQTPGAFFADGVDRSTGSAYVRLVRGGKKDADL